MDFRHPHHDQCVVDEVEDFAADGLRVAEAAVLRLAEGVVGRLHELGACLRENRSAGADRAPEGVPRRWQDAARCEDRGAQRVFRTAVWAVVVLECLSRALPIVLCKWLVGISGRS